MSRPTVSLRQVGLALAAFAALVVVGTVGFVTVADESAFDALYRTVITVYTAGLVSVPDSTGERVLTLVLVVWGVAVFLYVFGLVIELTVSGTVGGVWEQRRMSRRLNELNDHIIICGYGRVGRRAALEFRATGTPYVVLDFGAPALEVAIERGDLYVEGTGVDDDDLTRAGLERARGLMASSDSDTDNLYITLSARAARPDLFIVARASDDGAAKKLRLAGADRVVQPYSTAGQEMAKLVLKPQVAAFLEMLMTHGGPELSFEEIEVRDVCGHVGRTIRELRIRHDTGALVVGLRRSDGSFATTPSPDTVLEDGDVLIAVGAEPELRALEQLFAPRGAVAG